jgi:glycosyltransferase involved in cell wall biosynthesis
MRVVVWNAHWNTLGGGEVYAGYLAGYLAGLGNEVELVGVGENPISGLQGRLGLNLHGIRYTKIPNENYLLGLLKHDDLFINGSFGSAFASPVKKSVYICHFPLTSKKRKALAKCIPNNKNLVVSSDLSILHPIDDRVLLVGEGLAYYFANKKMSIDVEYGQIAVYRDFKLMANLESQEQYIFGPKGYYSVRSLSKVVPVTTISGASSLSWVRKFFVRRIAYQENFASSYSQIWANSSFTSGFILKYWKKTSKLIFPPHPERSFHSKQPNSYDILSIGRFMHPQNGHCKNQLELVEAFEKLCAESPLPWRLHLAGGVDPSDDRYFMKVKRLIDSKGLQIFLYPNCPQSELNHLLQTSQYYWHATGMGVAKRSPEDMEHFGIAVVESLNAGLIPLVYDTAGPAEILINFPELRFSSTSDLAQKTFSISQSDRSNLEVSLKEVSQKYSNLEFENCVDKALLDLNFTKEAK